MPAVIDVKGFKLIEITGFNGILAERIARKKIQSIIVEIRCNEYEKRDVIKSTARPVLIKTIILSLVGTLKARISNRKKSKNPAMPVSAVI